MIQELLVNGTALILGLIHALLGGGGSGEEKVVIAPPPMPALENFNPGVRPPTIEEVVYDLIEGAESAVGTTTPKPVPNPRPVTPSRPPVIPAPPIVIPPIVVDKPLPPPAEPSTNTSTTALLKGALVNIICTPAKGYNLRGTSGTGVVVDPRGIIVTVAHVGQHFLVENYPTANAGNCIIRTGSPAKNAYDAKLIYISTDWIENNKTTIISSAPRGTGEYDFAFLAITSSLTGSLPSSFTAVRFAPAGQDVSAGDDVSVGSYGAEFLTSSEIRSSLYPTITFGDIKEAYHFSGNDGTDIFSVQAGAAAQEGSSGGGVLDDNNRFLGLITTRTVKADLSLRDLQAITIDHLRAAFKADTGKDLDTFLKGNLSTLVSAYEDDVAELLDVIDDSIR